MIIIEDDKIERQLKYLQNLIISFNRRPNIPDRLLIEGATAMLCKALDCAVDIHFSIEDKNFLTYIRFYRATETVVTISSLSTETINIPADTILGQMIAKNN